VCDHATREGLPLIEYNAGKPLFPRGPRWPESRRGTWQARRSNPPHSRSRIAELLKPIYGDVEFTPAILSREDLAPPKPRFLVQYHAASVDEARASVPLHEETEDVIYQYEDEEEEDHQVRNNEQWTM
jgi:hypothetical protein